MTAQNEEKMPIMAILSTDPAYPMVKALRDKYEARIAQGEQERKQLQGLLEDADKNVAGLLETVHESQKREAELQERLSAEQIVHSATIQREAKLSLELAKYKEANPVALRKWNDKFRIYNTMSIEEFDNVRKRAEIDDLIDARIVSIDRQTRDSWINAERLYAHSDNVKE